jgi:hypothetical protein
MNPSRPPKKPRVSSPLRTTLRGPKFELNLLPTFKPPPEPAVETSVAILTQICRSQVPLTLAALVRNTSLPPPEAAAAIEYLARLGILVRIDERELYDLEPGTRAVKDKLTGGLSDEGIHWLKETIRASLSMPLDKLVR